MLHGPQAFLAAALATSVLAGCGSTSTGSSSGSTAPPPAPSGAGMTTPAPVSIDTGGSTPLSGTDDLVLATASQPAVDVVVGASRTVAITFASSDGRPLSGFAISAAAGALPAGWSAPATFDCGTVSRGSGCLLNLTYAPVAVAAGTLALSYVVVDNAGLARTAGVVSLAYAATPADNVLAAATPTGEVDAVAGSGSRQVTINFTTDDGNAATQLTVTTDLTSLPAGWRAASPALSCAVVAAGNGCQLTLTYAPPQAGGGTLTLDYAYDDDSGAPKTGTLAIPYATTASNTVTAAASPAGQITAVEHAGGVTVPVVFTTDDGRPATNLRVLSDLTVMPPGWSSAVPGFTCATVTSGSSCNLGLRFTPAARVSGTLPLAYTYVDAGGVARSGLLDIAYAATTDDNVIGTALPAGPVDTVVGDAPQPVTVTFTTDDARSATGFTLTGGLAALPPGWTSTSTAGTFTCAGIDADAPCLLQLSYAPAAAAAGTLTLAYNYSNNAGESKTGSVSVPYRATTNDIVVATPNPAFLNVATGSQTVVSVTFTTDDGNPASALTLGTTLSTLPPGWSSPATRFTCAVVAAGSPCSLTLTYAPSVADAGSLSLAFSYLNDSGTPQSGSLSLAYQAAP